VWWLGDHASRTGVRPWMLSNLVRALVRLGIVRKALEVCRSASALVPDGTSYLHRLLLAGPCAIDGQIDDARRALALALPDVRDDEGRLLARLTEAFIRFCQADAADERRREAFEQDLVSAWYGAPSHPVRDLCREHYKHLLNLLRGRDREGRASFWRRLHRIPSRI
jgi:hypothetical protein